MLKWTDCLFIVIFSIICFTVLTRFLDVNASSAILFTTFTVILLVCFKFVTVKKIVESQPEPHHSELDYNLTYFNSCSENGVNENNVDFDDEKEGFIRKEFTEKSDDSDICISHYFDDLDKMPRIVDYDKYVSIWNYYCKSQSLPYKDESKNYVVFVRIGFDDRIGFDVNELYVSENKIYMDVHVTTYEYDFERIGDGVIFIVPIDKDVEPGSINKTETLSRIQSVSANVILIDGKVY